MHDPMTVAFSIARPYPTISRLARTPDRRWRIGYTKFWTIAGRWELYWPDMVTVWHVDPSGYDSNEDCPYSGRWQWHVHHWRIQLPALQHLRRTLLTRCAWCGGPSRKWDRVNHSKQWDGERGPWWRGETGLYHADCTSISSAHAACACTDAEGAWDSELAGYPYGACMNCGKFRAWLPRDSRDSPTREVAALYQSIPAGRRDPAVTAQVQQLWRAYRN